MGVDNETHPGLISNRMAILDITTTDFSDPGKRRAWVQYQLKVKGRSLASLARELGVVRHAPGHALAKPYPRMEHAIAEAIGIPVQVLFPERYFPNGERSIRMGRGDRKSITKAIANDTTASQEGNVHSEGSDRQGNAV